MDVQKTMEFILEQQAHAAALQAKNEIDIRQLHAVLRRAIMLAVQEARHERQQPGKSMPVAKSVRSS